MSEDNNSEKIATMLREYDTGVSKVPIGTKVWLSGEVDEHFWLAYSERGEDVNKYLGLIPAEAMHFEL